jgi:hypothetical protein
MSEVDNVHDSAIGSPEDIAQFFRKSVSWVYKHWRELGGVKIGGSIFFPNKETLNEYIFGKWKGVEVRLHPEEAEVYGPVVSNQKRSQTSGGKKKGGNIKSQPGYEGNNNPNRHNLFGVDQ